MMKKKIKRHPGTLVLRGSTFWLHLSVGGKRHYFTIPTTDRREAETFATNKHAELTRASARQRLGLPGAIAFSELVDLFERQELPVLTEGTQAAYGDSLKALRLYFVDTEGDPSLDQIQARHVSGYLTWRRVNRLNGSAPLSNRTLEKDRAVLHRLFDMAHRMEYREGNPVDRVAAPKVDPREPVILDDAQYESLLVECADRPMLELYTLTMGESGVRCESEALRLRWADVDLEGEYLWISSARSRAHRTKSGKGRFVPMTPRLVAAMRRHFQVYRFSGSEWVFHHLASRWHYKRGARIGSMRHSFRSAAQRAKLPKELHQHDLRHRRVTTWLAEGRDVVLVRDAMGHSDLRTTMGYTHLAKAHLKKLVEPVKQARKQKKTG